MIDIKLIRQDPKGIEAKLKTKDPTVDVDKVFRLDQQLRKMKTTAEHLKAERNEISKTIGQHKREGKDVTSLMEKVSAISKQSHEIDHQLVPLEEAFTHAIATLPNIPMEGVKNSQNIEDNVVLKVSGEKPHFSFPFKNHLELNESLDLFDFKRGAKISGTGWPVYRGLGAQLEWALINYMIEIQIKNGFLQWILPTLVRPSVMFGSGQLPKFDNQQFKIEDEDHHLYMIPTAEIPLNGLHAEEILDEDQLPLKYVAYTPCFRREAGAAGAHERGLIRTHQFNKVEMFCFTKPEESEAVHHMMMSSAEEVLQGLGLHYRTVLLVTGDMSFASAKTVDVEVFLPGQDRYYEVSSISNCTDYQARRSHIRFRRKGEKPELVHTLNGSGLATSRLMVALLENNQNPDGTVTIPEVLRPKMGGLSLLSPKKEATSK